MVDQPLVRLGSNGYVVQRRGAIQATCSMRSRRLRQPDSLSVSGCYRTRPHHPYTSRQFLQVNVRQLKRRQRSGHGSALVTTALLAISCQSLPEGFVAAPAPLQRCATKSRHVATAATQSARPRHEVGKQPSCTRLQRIAMGATAPYAADVCRFFARPFGARGKGRSVVGNVQISVICTTFCSRHEAGKWGRLQSYRVGVSALGVSP